MYFGIVEIHLTLLLPFSAVPSNMQSNLLDDQRHRIIYIPLKPDPLLVHSLTWELLACLIAVTVCSVLCVVP